MLFVIIRKRTLTCIKKINKKPHQKRLLYVGLYPSVPTSPLCPKWAVPGFNSPTLGVFQGQLSSVSHELLSLSKHCVCSVCGHFWRRPFSLKFVRCDTWQTKYATMMAWWFIDPCWEISLCLFVHQQEGHRVKYRPGGNRCLAQWHGKQGGCMPLLQMFFFVSMLQRRSAKYLT